MQEKEIRSLLQSFRKGKIDEDSLLSRLRGREDLGFACIDHDRARRLGFPEVVFCEGKEPGDTLEISKRILERSDRLLLTRASAETARFLLDAIPDAVHFERARCLCVERGEKPEARGLVAVVAAGTSDLPVAEEARVTASMLGSRVETFYDVGVAGLHRLMGHLEELRKARVLVVVAGMEGALPSVVGGLVGRPILAVPTSVGYGASLGGLSALLAMLNSCSPGISVLNIDNGFGAGYQAALINGLGMEEG